MYLFRAVDQFGQVIDVYASTRRDSAPARRFFRQAGTITTGVAPADIIMPGHLLLGSVPLAPAGRTLIPGHHGSVPGAAR